MLSNMSGDVIGTATASAPGTCGELVQGMTGGTHFLVTCPINQFSRATVTLRVADLAESVAVVKGIDHLPKARQAVATALEKLAPHLGIADLTAEVAIANPIPAGKGMGSSSADITAALGAVGTAAGQPFSPESIARIALSVEPTDGVMFPGIALIDHRCGSISESLGAPPPLEVIVIDTGGTVDTLEFNRTDRTALWQEVASRTDEALELVREGIRKDDPELVGRGATISARAGHLPQMADWVERAAAFADEQGVAGINVAHSGTVVGILLDARERRSKPVYRRALEAFADAESVQHFRMIGGGVR
ncbi:MAG: GHMP kinase [Chloroflexota bacterium]|nr:GHMP kinase [Chloroflexota bacterium]